MAGQRYHRLRRPKVRRQLRLADPRHLDHLPRLRMLQLERPIEAHLGGLATGLGDRPRRDGTPVRM